LWCRKILTRLRRDSRSVALAASVCVTAHPVQTVSDDVQSDAPTRGVHGMGFPGYGNTMGMAIKHRNGNGRDWELPALSSSWEFIPKGFMLR